MEATLTGPEAAQALKILTSLGRSGARFNGRRVLRDIRSAEGRSRLLASVSVTVRGITRMIVRPMRLSRLVRPARSRRTAQKRAGSADPSPAALWAVERLLGPRAGVHDG